MRVVKDLPERSGKRLAHVFRSTIVRPVCLLLRHGNSWPIVVYSALRFGITPAVNALATLMLLVTVTCIVITALLLRRLHARVGPRAQASAGLGGALGLG